MSQYFLFAYDDDANANATHGCLGIFDTRQAAKDEGEKFYAGHMTIEVVRDGKFVVVAQMEPWDRWTDFERTSDAEPPKTPVMGEWDYIETYTNQFGKQEFTVEGEGATWQWYSHYATMREADGTAETKEAAMLAAEAWLVEQPYYARTIAQRVKNE